MDSLDDLPVAPTVLNPKEEASLQRLFQDGTSARPDSPPSSNIKLALACLVGLFVLLVNPWSVGVIEAIPKCKGNVAQLSIKTLVFLIVAYIVLQWIM
jgi:hypothetical protein